MTECPPEVPSPSTDSRAWTHRFASLGEDFFVPTLPTPMEAPYWIGRHLPLAQDLGIDNFGSDASHWVAQLAGNRVPPGAHPIATVYSGHQFGVWAGQLGDGRAILLGDLQGQEIQLKGAGLTAFSRMGDGRAVLRSSVREFLCSLAMEGLNIPTTRALCVIGSSLPVRRETMETAAVVTRVAPCFVRFGHFEHFSHHGQAQQLRQLADYVVEGYYPECRGPFDTPENTYAALLRAVVQRTAAMVAQWQTVGFCHGVMNTDNMSILGLTMDYGPFQFLDGYDPQHICNHSDTQGRYAFARQPQVAMWNLYCLGQAMLPLIDSHEHTVAALQTFPSAYAQEYALRMANKLGFAAPTEQTSQLAEEALKLLTPEHVDFTIFWRRLSQWAQQRDAHDESVRDLFVTQRDIDHWLLQYSQHIAHNPSAHSADLMLKTNPKYVLRNHLGQMAIEAAQAMDFSKIEALQTVLAQPFDEHPSHAAWADFPPDWASRIEISCSS